VITKRDDASRGLTREELLALPAAVDLETANRALSLSRTTGYDLAKRGRYPCTVLRLGNAYRVVTADLLKPLHIDVTERRGIEEETAATPEAEVGGFSFNCCCCCVRRCASRRDGERKGSADACGQCNTAYEQRDRDRCSDLQKQDLMRPRGTPHHDLCRPRNA
jgi:hypothetical protein